MTLDPQGILWRDVRKRLGAGPWALSARVSSPPTLSRSLEHVPGPLWASVPHLAKRGDGVVPTSWRTVKEHA